MTNKLLTLKQLAEIIKYATRIVTTYTDLGVAIPNDLERIVKLLDHITALESERAELPHDSLCATTISDPCNCYKRELLKQDQKS